MSILDLHADEMETAALNTRRDPYVPPRRSAWGGILTAAPRGAFRAAAEVGASLADIGGAVAAFRDTPSREMERGGLPASAFSSDLGDSVRSYWDSLKPDPLTATKTEQVLYGFARGAAKIIPATIAAGPVGALAAGVEEGMTVSDELRQQGVPDGTRQLAGIVQGAGLASAALPLVGRTLGETAALYLAGGPGGFVAQQALTRKILENAGQDQVAGQYDPFDPVGLTVAAALPGFFTYRALKGQAAARAVDAKATAAKAEADFMAAPVPSAKTATAQAAEAYTPSREAVDAAMVQNLMAVDDAVQARQENPADISMAPPQLSRQARHEIERNLLSEGKLQTRYMGNKREFFQENARFFAREVAPLVSDAETLVDVYAGGGTYGLTMALSGAMPKLKRVVINEVDPVRAERFKIAAERGAEIMRPWDDDPALVELSTALRPLVGKSSTPASLALSVYRGEASSPKYAWLKKMRARHGDLKPDSQAALLALHDVFFSGRTATWDRLMKNAAQDAARIQDLVSRAKERGIGVDVTSHDALGTDAADMVRSIGGNAVVVLDPPYHTTTSGTYSAGGKSYSFASDEFLAANMTAAKEMSDGNVVIYNNKDTPQVRAHFASRFGGSMSMRGWKRINGQREFVGVFDGTSKSRSSGLRVWEASGWDGAWLPDIYGGILGRPGGYARGQVEADSPPVVLGTRDSAAGTEPGLGGSLKPNGASAKAEIAPDTPVRLDESGRPVTFAADLAEVQRLAAEGTDETLGTLDADLFRVAVECALSGG